MAASNIHLLKIKIPELLIHYLWQSNRFSSEKLCCDDGRELKVLFQGWYNKGWGPDFKDAKILINNNLFFGDVEIHIDESAWYQHSHQEDDAYNKVILHVFLNPGQSPAKNHFGLNIPSLCLISSTLEEFWESITFDRSFEVKNLPGACGLYLKETGNTMLRKIIFQAAENRLITKSIQFKGVFNGNNQDEHDDALFTSICKSLGYSSNSEAFVSMSEKFPYSKLKLFFKSLFRQSRVEFLSRWFGYLGYLDTVSIENVANESRREWATLQQHWLGLNNNDTFKPQKPNKPHRPLNNSLRRLHGLFYHLESISFQGLTKSWLRFLQQCQTLLNENRAKPKILNSLDLMFPQPDWDPLNHYLSPILPTSRLSKTKLIGKQRQLIILINSIIPFFLSWSKKYNDTQLEKTLLALILILPAEGENYKTRFMENRLFQMDNTAIMEKNLSYYQGLMQIHDDCCTSFYEGCDNCSLIKMLSSHA
ncbi:DUF2851 family protein [bacterium]|nr:DUF2851 family protein [bacterium]